MRVYVAGPMSKGKLESNIRAAMDAANILLQNECEPFVPHLYAFLEIVYPQDYERWMRMDFSYIRVCKAVLRLPGESKGADRECVYAVSLGIPFFTNISDLLEWKNAQQETVRELAVDLPRVEPTSE